MRHETWMCRDERPLGTRISDLQSLAKNLREEAVRMEKRVKEMRQQADETERQVENLRTSL